MNVPEALELLGSRIKLLEILAVREGIKPAARILCPEQKLGDAAAFLGGQGLAIEESAFKVIKEPSPSGYSERSIRVGRYDARKGHVCLYLSQRPGTAADARSFEEHNDHENFGKALGYPPCCRQFFSKQFSWDNVDLTLDALEQSEGSLFPFHTNIAARHLDASLLSHFPCSFHCGESLAMAKKNFSLLESHAPGMAAEFIPLLRTGVLYTRQQGIIFLKGCRQEGPIVHFAEALASAPTKLYYFLGQEKQLKVEERNKVVIGSEVIGGKDVGVMLFQ